jgi:hypothetical protein
MDMPVVRLATPPAPPVPVARTALTPSALVTAAAAPEADVDVAGLDAHIDAAAGGREKGE